MVMTQLINLLRIRVLHYICFEIADDKLLAEFADSLETDRGCVVNAFAMAVMGVGSQCLILIYATQLDPEWVLLVPQRGLRSALFLLSDWLFIVFWCLELPGHEGVWMDLGLLVGVWEVIQVNPIKSSTDAVLPYSASPLITPRIRRGKERWQKATLATCKCN